MKYRVIDNNGNVVDHKRLFYTTLKRFAYPKLPEGKWYAIFKTETWWRMEVRTQWREHGVLQSEHFAWWKIEQS